MRKKLLIVAAVLVAAGLPAWLYISAPDTARRSVGDVTGTAPDILSPHEQSYPTVRVAKAVGWPNGAAPTAAPGLRLSAFATGLDHPRWLHRLPNGDILLAETNSPPRPKGGIKQWVMLRILGRAGAAVPSPNRIVLLRDTDRDGVADARTILVSGLNSPFGMALLGEHLYVANTDALVRYPFKVGQTRITAPPEHVVSTPPGGHWARNVIVAPDGKHLYVSVGSATNIADQGLEVEKNRATILEVDPVRKTWRTFAAGLRNPNGMAVEPRSRRLWTVVNERDLLGSDLPPDYLTDVGDGDHFGWPWYYWGQHPDPRVKPANPALRARSRRPAYALGPHTASLGLTFATDARLGATFAEGAFIGQHGSWNRHPPSGYKVIYVPFGSDGKPASNAPPVDVLTGFMSPDGEAWGRPVGVITDATGALLVADDVGNVIWRVSAAGETGDASRP